MPAPRRDQRYALRLSCEVHWQKPYPGTVKDVSQSGLFVYTAAHPPPGTFVTVRFPKSGNHREIRVNGIVVRVEDTTALAHLGEQGLGGIGIAVPLGALGQLLGALLSRGRDTDGSRRSGPR